MQLDTDTGKTYGAHGASCSCPACLGLQCLQRPRYFSGQLLTEADLNSEQAYMLAKSRLHNRYLHGSGIVCGLEVSCSNCVGAVTIQSGYAIDPCGNDVIVCDTQDFNVIKRIHECEKERKRQRKSNCDPITPPADKDCRDLERHYCLTIAYHEQETRLSPTLRQGSTTNTSNGKGSGCGCNGSGKKKGCSCNSSQAMSQAMSSSSMTQSSQSSQSSQSKMPAGCEPTRILEGYQLDISEVPPDYCGDAREILEDTLLAKVIDCVTTVRGFLDKKMPQSTYTVLTPLAFTGNVAENVSLDDLYRACCYLRQAIHDLYAQDPLNTHCQTLDVLSQVTCCRPPIIDQNAESTTADERACYIEQTRTTLYHLLALLMQYLLDCICQALLPTCSPAQADDRLILACMTVKDDQIIDICNFCHRRYAGSFPSLYYWLSLVPVIPLIAYAVERICCYDWLKRDSSDRQGNQQGSVFRGNLVNGLLSLLNSVDPSESLRKEIFAGNFAMPRNYASKFEQLISKVSSPAKVAELLHPGAFNLTKIIDKSVAEASAAMSEAGVIPVVHEVASANEAPILRHLTTSPFARAGDQVVLYHANDKVVGYAAYTSPPEIGEIKNNVATLKDTLAQVPQAADVNQLRSDVDGLKGDMANVAPSSALDPIRSDLEALKGEIANAAPSSALDPMIGDIEALKSGMANAALSSALDEVKNDIGALKENMANTAQAAEVGQLRSDLAQFAQATDVSQVRSDFDGLKSAIENAAQLSALDPIKGDIEALKGGMTSVAQSSALDEVKNDVEALKGSIATTAQTADVGQLRNDVDALKSDLAQVQQAAEVSQLRSDVDALRNDLASVPQSTTIDALKQDVETLQNNLATVPQAAEVGQIKSDVDALKENMANLPQVADVNGIKDEVTGIKSDIVALRNDLTNLAQQKPTPTKRISDLQATIKDLQDQLATMRTEIDQLKSGGAGGTPPS